jgi:methylthioribulose 1-phosphate dehydratase / enolase-phosphatase E1
LFSSAFLYLLFNSNQYFLHLLQCVVLDIEGTTTPISFVTDVMFPYARDNVRKHLTSTFDSEETKEDINLLRTQVSSNKLNGVPFNL